ncbi:F-box domain-containing protein [Mycena indigotica]|uniref:F-box domain-containing protein n=1 Tax=Mycena indigotica TaxID=2126181 RepID=A0A8H6S4X8_9AGAR|nr:F-box domain-containing protein [Mycena indigotica]KAF7292969.1 F-box domain-containing protein [Mycena indigotica]
MLNHDILFLVFLELPIGDIGRIRQVCRIFNSVTRTRSLWITLLNRLLDSGAVIPQYLGKLETLPVSTVEHLVRRLTHDAETNPEDTYPATLLQLRLTLSVTWLRLVAGNWLFVAASNEFESNLYCYDLSVGGKTSACLPGRVKTGKAEIQNGEIVLALGLGPEVQMVLVVTLRKHEGSDVLCELARLESSSHVLMLSGDIIGCAVRDGVNTPHLYCWREDKIIDVPPPPGGLDVPARRSVPHSILTWKDNLVIVRSHCLELYDMHLESVSFSKIVETSPIFEVQVYSSSPESLKLFVVSGKGIDMLSLICHPDETIHVERYTLIHPPTPPPQPENEFGYEFEPISHPLLYGLCVGASSQRILWISAADASVRSYRYPLHISSRLITHPPGDDTEQLLFVDFEDPDAPALYGVPAIDFDDVLGLVAIGNCFGELSVLDFSTTKNAVQHPRLTADFAVQPSVPKLLPSASVYSNPGTETTGCRPNWGNDGLTFDAAWKAPSACSWFGAHHAWDGTPSCLAWVIEYAYGFPGEALPQGYKDDDDGDSGHHTVIFRIGQRYFYFRNYEDPILFSWPLGRRTNLDLSSPNKDDTIDAQFPTSETAQVSRDMYEWFLLREKHGDGFARRNRWQELEARGGRPLRRYLDE